MLFAPISFGLILTLCVLVLTAAILAGERLFLMRRRSALVSKEIPIDMKSCGSTSVVVRD